jgi:hypothetical protein
MSEAMASNFSPANGYESPDNQPSSMPGSVLKEPSFSTAHPLPQYACTARQPDELIRIFDSRIQVVRWQRQEDQVIRTYFQHALTSGALGGGFRTIIGAGERLRPTFLPNLPGQNIIVDDICQLSDIYSELLGCDAVGLRLEVLHSAMCPRFHVDRTGIRLACAYLGSGTEWIDDRWVDRSRLGLGSNGLSDEASGLFDHRTTVEAAAPFDVVIFKGLLWQGNNERGAIHRSPAVVPGSGPRVLLVIDAVWN